MRPSYCGASHFKYFHFTVLFLCNYALDVVLANQGYSILQGEKNKFFCILITCIMNTYRTAIER